jgi:putative redox protein
MITVELARMDDAYHMAATNDRGNVMHLDNNIESGGKGAGIGPMQSLLAAAGGCSVIDVVSILKKQRQDLTDIKVTVNGERQPDVTPSLYQTVHMHFKLFGSVDADKAAKAIELSIEKYCSVAETLRRAGARVTYGFEIIKN